MRLPGLLCKFFHKKFHKIKCAPYVSEKKMYNLTLPYCEKCRQIITFITM
jgi:hypothetical protein